MNQATPSVEYKASPFLRVGAHIVSYIFHPLFIPTYVTAFLLYLHPYIFLGTDPADKIKKLAFVFFNTGFVMAFAVFLMRRLGLIGSLYLRTSQERIIPYAAATIFYFWAWYVAHKQPDNPVLFVQFLLGSFLAVCGAWLFNIRGMISMHATAMGGLVMFFLLLTFTTDHASGSYVAVPLLLAGLVTTCRLIVDAHSLKQITIGFILGALSQLIALWVGP